MMFTNFTVSDGNVTTQYSIFSAQGIMPII